MPTNKFFPSHEDETIRQNITPSYFFATLDVRIFHYLIPILYTDVQKYIFEISLRFLK